MVIIHSYYFSLPEGIMSFSRTISSIKLRGQTTQQIAVSHVILWISGNVSPVYVYLYE